MSYTKQQRNRIYSKALELLPTELFLCHSLSDSIKGGGQYMAIPEIGTLLPEFRLFFPDINTTSVWPLCDEDIPAANAKFQLPRQIILDFCILMTENETS